MKVKNDSKKADSICKIAYSHLDKGQHQPALVQFNAALECDAKHSSALEGKAKALVKLAENAMSGKCIDIAIMHLAAAHAIQPDNNSVHAELALLRFQWFRLQRPPVPFNVAFSAYAIDRLIFQGGGIKGIAYLGAIKVLFERFVNRSELKACAGSSAGAIMAFMIAVGMSYEDMHNELTNLNFVELMDGDYRDSLLYLLENKDKLKEAAQDIGANIKRINNFKASPSGAASAASSIAKALGTPDLKLLRKGLSLAAKDKFGLFPGNYFRENLAERILHQTTGIHYCTFAEHHALCLRSPDRYKDLYITVANITKKQVEILSHETSPDDIISDGLRASMSIPGVFEWVHRYIKKDGQRIPYSEDIYVDGATTEKYPIWIFDRVRYLPHGDRACDDYIQNPYTLGFRLVSGDKKQTILEGKSDEKKSKPPKDVLNYIFQLGDTINSKQEADHLKNLEQYRTIYIDHMDIPAIQFNLSEEVQAALIRNGSEATLNQMEALEYEKRQNIPSLSVWDAIAANDTARVEHWLRGGFKINSHNEVDATPLDIAFNNKHIPMILCLLAHGATNTKFALEIIKILKPLEDNVAIDQKRLALWISSLEANLEAANSVSLLTM